MKGVFIAEDPGTSQKPAAHPSPQPQQEKHTKIASQPRFNCDVDIYLNYDLDAQTESELGLVELYNRLGMSEHDLNADITSDVPDLVDIHGLTVASCPGRDSPAEGPVCVKGRLRDHLSFWHGINANRWVTSIIRDGYALPFVELPPAKEMENHKSAWDEKQFVTEQIEELLLSGCIREVSLSETEVVSPLGVVTNSVKKRLILDLRYVNNFLRIPKFKYEDIRTARDIFMLGDWFFKFDYKSGYHHVDILPTHQKYLGFSWTLAGVKKWFVFSVLPFGLASAPYVFTKIQKALVKHWREQGIRIFTYLDDGAGAEKSLDTARAASKKVREDIEASGFVAHPEKCSWEPTQVGELLGFILNLREGIIQVPLRRIKSLRDRIDLVVRHNSSVTARQLAGLVGSIVSMGLALGPVSRLWTRAMYYDILSAEFWSQHIALSPEAMREVQFWKESFDDCHGQPIWKTDPKIDVIAYLDASDSGWGGYCVNVGGTSVAGSWSEAQSRESSTWRELRGTRLVLMSTGEKLVGKTVRHRTDNMNVERILKVGSPKPKLHSEAVAIYTLCKQYQIHLEPEWVPREFNQEADELSRLASKDDYMLNPNIFAALDILWGPHTVDRFSTFRTRQVPHFCSRWLNPCTEGVDAFTLDWSGENNWIFPPPYLIPRVLKHMEHGGEIGTLVIPLWTSAAWWPLITTDGTQPEEFVRDWVEIPPSEDMFLPAMSGSSVFSGIPSYRVLALRVSFSSSSDHTARPFF